VSRKGEIRMSIERPAGRGMVRRETCGGRETSRRNFLKLSGAGLVGVRLLGAAGCGGDEGSGANLRWSMWADTPQEKAV
jgi:hypothetical protein